MKRVILLIGLLLSTQVEAASMNSEQLHVRVASVNSGGLVMMSPTDLAPEDPGYMDVGGTPGPGAGAGASGGATLDAGVGFWHAASGMSSVGGIEVPEPGLLPGLMIGPLALAALARRRTNGRALAVA